MLLNGLNQRCWLARLLLPLLEITETTIGIVRSQSLDYFHHLLNLSISVTALLCMSCVSENQPIQQQTGKSRKNNLRQLLMLLLLLWLLL